MSLNKACLIGNVGRDPEVRFTQAGDPVANFSLATTDRWKSKAGDKQQVTEWHNIVAFGKLAEIVRDYVKKGKQIYLEGALKTESWRDKNGIEKRTTKIHLTGFGGKLVLLGGRDDGPKESAPSSGSYQATDDDVPF